MVASLDATTARYALEFFAAVAVVAVCNNPCYARSFAAADPAANLDGGFLDIGLEQLANNSHKRAR